MRAATETGSAPRAARSSRSAEGSSGRAEGEREGLAGEQSGGSVVINRSLRRQDVITFRSRVRKLLRQFQSINIQRLFFRSPGNGRTGKLPSLAPRVTVKADSCEI
jgi:hypothetical protein